MVTELQDLRDDGMWMQLEEMGERPDLLRDPFEDDEPLECETKGNRLVEFPSQYQHTVTPMTTPERRVLINFNFMRALPATDGQTFISHGLAIQHPMS